MHKIGSGNFETADGQTVKGSLVVMPPEDGDYTPGRVIGNVAFAIDNENEEKEEDRTSKEADKSQGARKSDRS